MVKLPLHIEPEIATVEDNCLVVGGSKLCDLAERSAGTPAYLYDSGVIRSRVQALRERLPDDVRLHYAIKANPMPEIVRMLSELLDGLDVASAGELRLATQCQVPREEISFAGPGKTDTELRAAIEAGIVVILESSNEMRRATGIAAELERRAMVAVRINPDFELKGSGMRMGGGAKPFGIDVEQVPKLLEQMDQGYLDFTGFHIFSGSQSLSAEAISDAQAKSIDLAIGLADRAPRRPSFVNIGGGFGIPYFKGDAKLNLAEVGARLEVQMARFRSALPDTSLVIELGRYLVGEAGLYVCEVIDKKVSRGKTFLVTNGGLHHHLAASGNFGQVIRKNYPVLIGNRIASEQLEEVTIVGPLCTPLDVIASDVTLPKAEVGDLVVVFQSGAYGLTASPRGFLSHPDALEQLL